MKIEREMNLFFIDSLSNQILKFLIYLPRNQIYLSIYLSIYLFSQMGL